METMKVSTEVYIHIDLLFTVGFHVSEKGREGTGGKERFWRDGSRDGIREKGEGRGFYSEVFM